jgi:hypothetical protein
VIVKEEWFLINIICFRDKLYCRYHYVYLYFKKYFLGLHTRPASQVVHPTIYTNVWCPNREVGFPQEPGLDQALPAPYLQHTKFPDGGS